MLKLLERTPDVLHGGLLEDEGTVEFDEINTMGGGNGVCLD